MIKCRLFLFSVLFFCFFKPALSQWVPDSSLNNPVAKSSNYDSQSYGISDGAGGVIYVWITGFNVYAQRINSAGVLQWAENGVPVSVFATSGQGTPVAVSDGAGGVIIAWVESRNSLSGIYAQRINGSGVRQWGDNDVVVSTDSNTFTFPRIISDGSGGAIVTWNEMNLSSNYFIYAQKINSSGVTQWGVNGVAVRTLNGSNGYLNAAATDGSGGVFITWTDTRRFGSGLNQDIYLQKINSAGTVQFAVNGITVCFNSYDARNAAMISDNAGGVIVSWSDARFSIFTTIYSIFAQRMNSSGVAQWTENGINVCSSTYTSYFNNITTDGANGAFVTWAQQTPSQNWNWDISAQKIDGSGNLFWTVDGAVVSSDLRDQTYPKIVSDGLGGAVLTWLNTNNNVSTNMSASAQHLNSAGTSQWIQNGVFLSGPTLIMGASNYYYMGYPLLTPVTNGYVVAWEDFRDYGPNLYDVYAQYITSGGFLPVELTNFSANVNDNEVMISWTTASELNNHGFELYRSEKGKNDFSKIVFINGSGSSSVKNNYSYVDKKLSPGKYIYMLKQIDVNGTVTELKQIYADVNSAPNGFTLAQNYPNPFNPRTRIDFQLDVSGLASLKVYNVLGEEVSVLLNEMKEAGSYSVELNAEDMRSGVYYYTLTAGNRAETRKMSVLK